MAGESNILRILGELQQQVTAVQKYLVETQQAEPNFDGHAPEPDYSGIDDTRAAALESMMQLRDLLSTPREILAQVVETDFVSRHVLDRLNIYDLVPVGETRTYEQLAAQTGQRAPILRRLIRHGITQRIFREPVSGTIAHSTVSRLLAENTALRDYYGVKCAIVWPAAARVPDALEKWPGSKSMEQTAYQLAHGKTVYEMLEADNVLHTRYNSAMASHQQDRTLGMNNVTKGWDWASLGTATVVDIGGGLGQASKVLAKAFPQLNFIVQDRAEVVTDGIVEDPELQGRVRFMAHNFFEPQPVEGAAVYMFRRVFMEWENDKVIEIINALAGALKPGSRVLIQDPYVPAPGTLPLWQEKRLRSSELLSLALSNGPLRELEDWPVLTEKLKPGFHYVGVTEAPNSDVTFVELVWQ